MTLLVTQREARFFVGVSYSMVKEMKSAAAGPV